jgi:uncharacterized protein
LAKLLFFALIVFVLVVWLKGLGRPRRDLDAKRRYEVEDMVRCQVCGVNLPRSEAILSQGRIYCSEEHRRRDLG